MAVTTNPADALLAAALAAVARGWHVFPCRAGRKQPALHGERACQRTGICRARHLGYEQRATADPDHVRWYWSSRRFAGCNIGIACGPSGLLVIDLDLPKPHHQSTPTHGCTRGKYWADGGDPGAPPATATPAAEPSPDLHPAGGWTVLARLAARAGQPMPTDTHTVTTPTGGTHLYYRQPAGLRLRNTRGDHGGLGPLIDTRGHGGYVLAPGSITPTGTYRLTRHRPPTDLAAWLVQALTPKPPTDTTAATTTATVVPPARLPRYVTAALHGEAHRVATAADTTHTSTVFTAAIALGQLVGAHHLPPGTAEDTLLQAAAHMITGPCDCTQREITRTITNGLRRGATQPRHIGHPRQRPA